LSAPHDAFDTHCHLDLADFDEDREAVWARATTAGVTRALIPAVGPADWPRTLAALRHGARYAALGIHPCALPALSDEAVRDGLDALAQTARAHAGAVVAIGECGLDGALDLSLAPWERQRAALAAQIEVAVALDLPLVLHVYKAHEQALEALAAQRLPSRGGVVHSFSGSAELARAYLGLGLHLSFGGGLTRPNAKRPAKALRATDPARLLFETDAPDQLPTGVDRPSRRCEPADLAVVIAHAAALLGADVDALNAEATRSARALFAV
jgi:TatD DNase family protein